MKIKYELDEESTLEMNDKIKNIEKYRKLVSNDHHEFLIGTLHIEHEGNKLFNEYMQSDYILKIALGITDGYNKLRKGNREAEVWFYEDPFVFIFKKLNENIEWGLYIRDDEEQVLEEKFMISFSDFKSALSKANNNLFLELKEKYPRYWDYILNNTDIVKKMKI